mgnify:CR=1 FL=1
MRRFVPERLVRSRGVVMREVGTEPVAHVFDVPISVCVDVFVLHRSPQSFREDVVHAPASSIHADQNFFFFQDARVVLVRVLHSLIGIVDVRRAVCERVVQCIDAECGFHRRRHVPRQDRARVPIEDRGQVAEPSPCPNVRDVGAPDVVRVAGDDIAQEVRIRLVPDEGNARPWLGIYGFEPEHAPKRTQSVLPDVDAVIAFEHVDELQDAVLRMIGVLFVECGEDAQVFFVHRKRCRVDRGARDAEELGLPRKRYRFMVAFDQCFPVSRAMGQIFF